MGQEMPAGFYDDHIGRTMEPLLLNPWLPIWLLACQWIEADPPGRIIDLGCGVGRFAELLYHRGYKGSYLGVDFSPRTVRAASCQPALAGRPCEFLCADLRDYNVAASAATLIVCLETLEHLTDDLDVVQRLPSDARLLFSVPNFDSDAHVRHLDQTPAYNRYGSLVEFRRLGRADLSPPAGRYVSMFEGWRR